MSATDPVPFPTKQSSAAKAPSATPSRPAASPAAKAAPKWELECKERIRVFIRKTSKSLADLVARDANEANTRMFITDFLSDALGYSKLDDLDTEYRIRGDFADYGIRIDKQLVAFLESKRATTKLATKHLHQVQLYAVNEGVAWIILTNGVEWRVYHITGGLPVVVDPVFVVDLLGPDTVNKKADLVFYISREALKRRLIDELWRQKAATSPKALVAALLSEKLLKELRLEIKRNGHNADESELARLLKETVIRPEAL